MTGADVALPGAGGTNPYATAVYPMPGGNWLVRRASDPVLTIVSAQAEEVGSVTETFELSRPCHHAAARVPASVSGWQTTPDGTIDGPGATVQAVATRCR